MGAQGYAYDCIFLDPKTNQSYAQIPYEQKQKDSAAIEAEKRQYNNSTNNEQDVEPDTKPLPKHPTTPKYPTTWIKTNDSALNSPLTPNVQVNVPEEAARSEVPGPMNTRQHRMLDMPDMQDPILGNPNIANVSNPDDASPDDAPPVTTRSRRSYDPEVSDVKTPVVEAPVSVKTPTPQKAVTTNVPTPEVIEDIKRTLNKNVPPKAETPKPKTPKPKTQKSKAEDVEREPRRDEIPSFETRKMTTMYPPKKTSYHDNFLNSLKKMSNEHPSILSSFIKKYAKQIEEKDFATAIKLFKIAQNIQA